MVRVPPCHSKELMMNELFLAMAEERRLKAQREAQSRDGHRSPGQQNVLSPDWGQRLFQVLGHRPKQANPH